MSRGSGDFNWTYRELFPDRSGFTLTNPTQFLDNHRKSRPSPQNGIQINLDYLDLIEAEAHGHSLFNDFIVLGHEFASTLIVEGKCRKTIYLQNSNDIDIVIEEVRQRIPNSKRLIFLNSFGEKFIYDGLNTENLQWHSATELYSQFSKITFRTLLEKLKYQNQNYALLKSKQKLSNRLEIRAENLHYRLVNQKPGFYELTDKYPKLQKVSKFDVAVIMSSKVKQGIQLLDNSYGIYFISDAQRLYVVKPSDNDKSLPG